MTRGGTGIAFAAAVVAAGGLAWWLLGGDGPPSTPRPKPERAARGDAPDPRDGGPAAESPVAGPPAPAAGPGGPVLRGRVQDRLGRPVAGAAVEARPPSTWAAIDLATLADAVLIGSPPAAAARSGADGSFVLAGLAPGRWDLRASAPGHGPARGEGVVPRAEAETPPVVLVLGPGHGLLVRVVDGGGAGLPGVAVAAASPVLGPLPEGEALARGTTDANGEARLEGLPPGRLLVAARAGPGRIAGRDVDVPGEDEVEIAIGGTATLVVRVLSEGAGPVPGAAVTAMLNAEEKGGGALLQGAAGDDGVARFEGLAPGTIGMVSARAPGFAPTVLGGPGRDWDSESSALAEDATREIEVRLRAGAVLAGSVLLQPGGGPVSGARVTVILPEFVGILPSRSALSDAAGAYRVEDLPAGRAVAFAHGDGAATPGALPGAIPAGMFNRRREPSPLAVEIAPGPAETRHDLLVEPTGSVSGRVLAADGSPAAGARVQVAPAGRAWGSRSDPGDDLPPPPAVAGEDGTFVVEPVPRAEGLVAIAEADGRVPAASAPFAMAAGGAVEGVEIRLSPGGVVAGRVTGPDGKPIAGARVRARPLGRPGVAGPAMQQRSAYSDAEGDYRIAAVAAGPVAVSAEAGGFVPEPNRNLEAREGEETRADFSLEAGLEIRGRVLDAAGAPVAGARVRARNTDRRPTSGVRSASARTARDGAFVLGELPPGTWDLEALSPDHPQGSVTGVASGGASVDIRLPEGVRISGRVADASGNPIPGVRVNARGTSAGARSGSARTRDDGAFEIRNLTAGAYALSARSEGPGWTDAQVDSVEGGSRSVEIRLERALGLFGRVRGPDGETPSGRGRIRVLDHAGKQVGATRWDRGGAFQVAGLMEGTYTLVARQDGDPALQATITARAGSESLEIRLSPE